MRYALILAFLVAVGAPASDSTEAVRAKATALFRAKKYEQARELFVAAAKRAPKDGAIVADLALCLQRLGRTEEATKENYRALALAATADDTQTRKNVYFNLAQLGVMVKLPTNNACAKLASPPGCAKQLYACGFGGTLSTRVQETAWVTSDWTAARIATNEAEAKTDGSEYSVSMPDNTVIFERYSLSSADVFLSISSEARAGENFEGCNVVVVDACTGYVGLSCLGDPDAKGKRRKEIHEFGLTGNAE